jgi:hypothetical protein
MRLQARKPQPLCAGWCSQQITFSQTSTQRTKREQLGVRWEHRLANVLQRRVDAPQEHGQARVDGLMEVRQALA